MAFPNGQALTEAEDEPGVLADPVALIDWMVPVWLDDDSSVGLFAPPPPAFVDDEGCFFSVTVGSSW